MSFTREKRARFFRAYILDNGARVDVNQVDWQAVLENVSLLEKVDRTTVEGVRFEAYSIGDTFLLGVHKPLDPNFLSQEDPDTSSIVDIMNTAGAGDDEREAPKLFNSTGVLFLPIGNVFALTQGGVGAKKQGAVRDFMDKHANPGPGRHWMVEPLIDESQIEEFRGANRAKAVETVIDSKRLLLDENGNIPVEAGGIASLPDRLAVAIGGDVKITMKVELLPESRNLNTQKNLYDQVRSGLARLIEPKAATRVTTVLDDGTNEVLELAAHDLASSFEVDATESEVMQFSTLMAHLSSVGAEMEDRVRAIIEGVDDVRPTT